MFALVEQNFTNLYRGVDASIGTVPQNLPRCLDDFLHPWSPTSCFEARLVIMR